MKVTPQDLIVTIKNMMLLSAAVHLVILFVYAAKTGSFSVLNIFRILNIELFFPQILQIPSIDIIAILFTVIFFLVMLFLTIRKK